MARLHELIAVEKDIKTTAEKIIKETTKTFKDKESHFEGMERYYETLNDDDKEVLDGERKENVTTVSDKLNYFDKHMVKLFDCLYQKESTNQAALGDIVVKTNGADWIIEEHAPVTFLVQIEKILGNIRNNVYNSIPTLAPAKRWEVDKKSNNLYTTSTTKKLRSKKIPKVVSLAKATKEHPEQTQLITEDRPTGYWYMREWSGMLSTAEKSELLNRVDNVIIAIKKARARANNIEIVKCNIGHKIFEYIKGDK